MLFYRRLAGEVPMRVAKPYVAEAAHWCNRICLGLEYLGPPIPETAAGQGWAGSVTADWRGGAEPQLAAVVGAVAKMHRRFWGRTGSHPVRCPGLQPRPPAV